jgi:HPt (histidine-containing phosphotransfer) domain-containing protein
MSTASLPVSGDSRALSAVIDEEHLARMTLGDVALEREVLSIFLRQMTLTMRRLEGAAPEVMAAAAHTVKGSARGLGVWRVARGAERLEEAVVGHNAAAMEAAVAELEATCLEACAAIGERLGGDTGLSDKRV